MDIRSGTVIGMEALLRWQHPQEGLLMPARFMDALEETGLIVPVGAWILRSACEQNTAWQKMGLPPLAVSVNISPRQFRQRDFVDSVAAALERTAMRGSLLELEFTEDLLRENEEHSVRTLDSLNRLGVKLTLDNFGSGVVSFKSLMKFPIHAIKIDRSLIQDASHNASGAAIAKAAIEVAHIFHIKGLAEGVETSAHLDTVKRIACDDAQGYLYSPPLPPSAFAELIQGNRPLHENSLQ
ncbi:EAL domain-containing protein [Methylogaea oryzae]|uniref:EAL domain-containing protein n=1 Tax=Methylogaea oryzae TaxID=1295382 RepID=UPI0006D215E0|nr:EAL domain-containing protein [Methylogaea oryzae]